LIGIMPAPQKEFDEGNRAGNTRAKN